MAEQYPVSPQAAPAAKTSTMAIISLILGILSFMVIPILGGVGSLITGILARKEIKDSGGVLTGGGMATAGVVLGIINLLLILIPICVIVILALLGPAIGNVFSNIVVDI